MAPAKFEEKQYENAANMELARHHPAVFPPGQVLEAVLAYDVAAYQPNNSPIWTLLGAGAPPGITLTPNFWQRASQQPKAADLPSHYVSILLQYKRPEYMERRNAKQWPLWNDKFYRFAVATEQHDTLCQLSQSLSDRAQTAYASPVFSNYWQLENFQMNGEVLENSNFVDPTAIGKHTIWTYNVAGTVGKPNPNGNETPISRFKEWWRHACGRARKENLYEHLRGLAEAETEALGDELPPWADAINEVVSDANEQQIQAVLDIFQLGQSVGFTGASWFVVDVDT